MTTPTPGVVRVTFYDLPGMTEPSVELWYKTDAPLCELGEAETSYGYVSINPPSQYRPEGITDAEWFALAKKTSEEPHLFSAGREYHPGNGRSAEAAEWARRYGWVES